MRFYAAVMFSAALAASCADGEAEATGTDAAALPDACKAIPIDRFKELVFVDEGIVDDVRSKNALDGPWSFRRRMRDFAGGDEAAAVRLTTSWLESWKSADKVNVYDVPARPFVKQKALCNWLRATATNGCDATCSACDAQTFDLANAPFRLIAIVNRADLVTHEHDPTTLGEARFVYALTNGPGDSPSSPPLVMTVIFEYRQALRGRTRREVANAWHALARHADYDEPFKTELAGILRGITEPGAEPDRPRGSAINQIRINEREFEWRWEFREYLLEDSGIELTHLDNTPDWSLNRTPALARFLRDNEAAIMAKEHVLPVNLAGGGISNDVWAADGVREPVLSAFAEETCNGCHLNRQIAFNFHVSPFATGRARLSPFMNDPADPSRDELSRRELELRRLLCDR